MTSERLSVASWNVHQGLHNDGGTLDVLAGLQRIDADVVALQEGWWHETDRSIAVGTARELGYEVSEVIGAPRSGRHTKRRIALLSRHPIRSEHHILLPSDRRRERRPVLTIDVGGLCIAATHLHGIHLMKRSPRAWRRELAAFASAASTADVVMGDLNMWSPPIHRALDGHRAAVVGRTWPSWRPHSQIDHIMVAERVDVSEAAVLPDMGSDHRAVRAVLEFAPRN